MLMNRQNSRTESSNPFKTQTLYNSLKTKQWILPQDDVTVPSFNHVLSTWTP